MDDFKRKLIELEVLYGTQKKAAEKLGISARTFRKYKKGSAPIPSDRIKQINRFLGNAANKEKLSNRADKLEKKLKTFADVEIEATNKWLNSNYSELKERWIAANIVSPDPRSKLSAQKPYVAYPAGKPRAVQFVDGMETPGKRKGITYMTVTGIISLSYFVGTKDELEKGQMIQTKVPLLNGINEEWNLEKTLAYAEREFMRYRVDRGRMKFLPVRFIGYSIQ